MQNVNAVVTVYANIMKHDSCSTYKMIEFVKLIDFNDHTYSLSDIKQ